MSLIFWSKTAKGSGASVAVSSTDPMPTAATNLELADDVAFSVASSKVMPMGALADDTSPDSVDEGDVGIPRMSLARVLRVAPGNDAGLNLHIADDAAFTVATSLVAPMGALADDTTPDSVDEGDIGIPRMSLARVLRVAPGNDAGLNLHIADDAGFTVGTSLVTPIGAIADDTSPDSVDEGDVGIPRMTLTRILRSAPTLFSEKTNGTGSAAIATSKTVAAGTTRRLTSVSCHLSSAPTSAGSLTVTLNANAGAAYDTLLATTSMVGVTDYVYTPDPMLVLETADAIDVAYANPDSRTYGVQITFEGA